MLIKYLVQGSKHCINMRRSVLSVFINSLNKRRRIILHKMILEPLFFMFWEFIRLFCKFIFGPNIKTIFCMFNKFWYHILLTNIQNMMECQENIHCNLINQRLMHERLIRSKSMDNELLFELLTDEFYWISILNIWNQLIFTNKLANIFHLLIFFNTEIWKILV